MNASAAMGVPRGSRVEHLGNHKSKLIRPPAVISCANVSPAFHDKGDVPSSPRVMAKKCRCRKASH